MEFLNVLDGNQGECSFLPLHWRDLGGGPNQKLRYCCIIPPFLAPGLEALARVNDSAPHCHEKSARRFGWRTAANHSFCGSIPQNVKQRESLRPQIFFKKVPATNLVLPLIQELNVVLKAVHVGLFLLVFAPPFPLIATASPPLAPLGPRARPEIVPDKLPM